MKVLAPDTIQTWEDRTIAAGTDTASLMSQAVHGLYDFITSRFPTGRALVACGKGNNGNDALWLAHEMRKSGWSVTVWLSHPTTERITVPSHPEPISMASQDAMVFPATPATLFKDSEPLLIIDGILGLGASGAPRGSSATMIEWLMQHRRPQDIALSLDTPSGLDGNTGECFTPSFRADYTVAIGAVKQGCLSEEASSAVGRLSAIPIDLSDPAPASRSDFFTIEQARALFTRRHSSTYKHQQGTVHLWAGSSGMCGAAILASRAALRSGAGLVRLFSSEEVYPHLLTTTPEIMLESITLSKKLNKNILKADCLLVGPGMGTDPETAQFFSELIASAEIPLVIDADGLTLCSAGQTSLSSLPGDTILTPHTGEFRRLLPQQSGSRQQDVDLFTSLNPHLILTLKGPNTLVAAADTNLSYNGSGNPGMATAGSGDVLAGLIAGLRARGFSAWDAARLGVFWHGLAGDLAATKSSEDTLTAGDVLEELGTARALISRP